MQIGAARKAAKRMFQGLQLTFVFFVSVPRECFKSQLPAAKQIQQIFAHSQETSLGKQNWDVLTPI